jgi:hypothetical protein
MLAGLLGLVTRRLAIIEIQNPDMITVLEGFVGVPPPTLLGVAFYQQRAVSVAKPAVVGV